MRTGIGVALATLIAAVAMISGSNAVTRRASEDDVFSAERATLRASLENAGARLNELSRTVPRDSSGQEIRVGVDALIERRHVILAALDSVANETGDAWRGAMPGLRANVADLEARVDRIELTSIDSVAVTDELLREWLDDASRRMVALDALADRSAVFAAHMDEIDSLRTAYATHAQRLSALSGVDDDPYLREQLGEELIALRRRLRALERAAGPELHPRFP